MRRATLAVLLLVSLAATASGLGRVCPGPRGAGTGAKSEGRFLAGTTEKATAASQADLPPCHRKASAASETSAGAPASPTPAPHSKGDGKGCCDPASGTTCPHACHILALPGVELELAGLSAVAPLLEAPSAVAPAPLPRGVDHIPLA